MIKLTYTEAKEAAITETISQMKDFPMPAKLSWRLMKIHRKLKAEFADIQEQLRVERLKHVVKDEKGEVVPVAEEKDAEGKVTKPAQAWQWSEGGEAAMQKFFAELISVEFTIDEDPIDISVLMDKDVQISHLAGLEPLTADYQTERLVAVA